MSSFSSGVPAGSEQLEAQLLAARAWIDRTLATMGKTTSTATPSSTGSTAPKTLASAAPVDSATNPFTRALQKSYAAVAASAAPATINSASQLPPALAQERLHLAARALFADPLLEDILPAAAAAGIAEEELRTAADLVAAHGLLPPPVADRSLATVATAGAAAAEAFPGVATAAARVVEPVSDELTFDEAAAYLQSREGTPFDQAAAGQVCSLLGLYDGFYGSLLTQMHVRHSELQDVCSRRIDLIDQTLAALAPDVSAAPEASRTVARAPDARSLSAEEMLVRDLEAEKRKLRSRRDALARRNRNRFHRVRVALSTSIRAHRRITTWP